MAGLSTRAVILVCALGVSACSGGPALETEAEQRGYALGQSIGRDLLEQGAEIELEALRRGLHDGLAAQAPEVDAAQMKVLLGSLKSQIVADHPEQAEVRRPGRAEEAPFLAANAAREGVRVLDSGVQLEIREPGTGEAPTPNDTVLLRYRSSIPNGQVFHDNLEAEPESHPMASLVPGLSEALTHVKVGGKAHVVVPSHLAFLNFKMGPLARRAAAYEVELVGIEERSP